jgi:hypothetical protein
MRFEVEKTTRWPAWALWPVVGGSVWLSLIGAFRFLYPVRSAGVVLCPLKRMSGVPCPTCGATRSVLSLLNGNPGGAIAYNPLFFAGTMLLFAVVLIRLVLARKVRIHVSRTERLGIWVLLTVFVLSNWAYVICMGR